MKTETAKHRYEPHPDGCCKVCAYPQSDPAHLNPSKPLTMRDLIELVEYLLEKSEGNTLYFDGLYVTENETFRQAVERMATHFGIIRRTVVQVLTPKNRVNEATVCIKCGGYVPGHATGNFDICTCSPITTR